MSQPAAVLDSVDLTKGEKQALHDIVHGVRAAWPSAKIYVFGSKVRGMSDAESDVDLLAVLPCDVAPETRRNIVHAVFDANLRYDSNVSIMVFSDTEWNNSPMCILPIHSIVQEEGILL